MHKVQFLKILIFFVCFFSLHLRMLSVPRSTHAVVNHVMFALLLFPGQRVGSALGLACENGTVQGIQILLQFGAMINRQEYHNGMMPLHIACRAGA